MGVMYASIAISIMLSVIITGVNECSIIGIIWLNPQLLNLGDLCYTLLDSSNDGAYFKKGFILFT